MHFPGMPPATRALAIAWFAQASDRRGRVRGEMPADLAPEPSPDHLPGAQYPPIWDFE